MLKLKSVLLIYFLIIYVATCKAINYCNSDICNISKQHMLCKFQFREPASHCIDFEVTLKTAEDKIAILDKINSRRNKVASGDIRSLPSADNMLKLEWNVELEKSAQRWADQCVKHAVPDAMDNCRNLDNVYVGQNIATIHGDAPGLKPLVLVDVWYMELLHINTSILSNYLPSKESGNTFYDYFTQLVWAESSQVGCGAVKFKERYEDKSGSRNRTIYRLVCNFAPGGNRLNQPVFNTGVPCSRCPPGYACDIVHKSLCGLTAEENHTKVTSNLDISMNLTESHNIEMGRSSTKYTEKAVTGTSKRPIQETSTQNYRINKLTELKTEEDTPFDYFSNLHDFTKNVIIETTVEPHKCKDVLAVEEFLDLLKQKISSDAMFKDVLITSSYSDHSDSVTDPSVVAFVSRIYSKKIPPTTTKVTENDIVNSTLLVDLVEAIIFRSGDSVSGTKENRRYSPSIVEINPVKVKAELAEVKENQDFTGHYFFPEEDDEISIETTESYYDTSDFPVSDVVLEIEELKRRTTIKDFLFDILESDAVTVNARNAVSLLVTPDSTAYKNKLDYIKNIFKHISEESGE